MHSAEANDLLSLCASYPRAVDETIRFGRSQGWFSLRDLEKVPSDAFLTSSSGRHPDLTDPVARAIVKILSQRQPTLIKIAGQQMQFELSLTQPRALVRAVLPGIRADHDLRYFTARSIRRFYNIVLSAALARDFHALCQAGNLFIAEGGKSAAQFLDVLGAQASPQIVDFFIESCLEVGYLSASYQGGEVHFKTNSLEAEFLISNLFGIPTGILGLDDLFGGGGLLLYENPGDAVRGPNHLSGRTLLIRGRFGTGKTILALQLAVEVARKGGLAWVVPLEQSAEECEYTIASMGSSPLTKTVTNVLAARAFLRDEDRSEGAVIILKVEQKSLPAFLDSMAENVTRMETGRQYSLRMLVMDPISTIHLDPTKMESEVRADFQARLSEIRSQGTNVTIVAEENTSSPNDLGFAENVADTVVHLTVDKRLYAQRYIEITKSRLQREQRGEHPFSIIPGYGIRIYPSTPAVSARIRNRRTKYPGKPVRLGVPAIDQILGKNGIYAGDVVALQGPEGSFRTSLALYFLLTSDHGTGRRINRRMRSLLVDARTEEKTIQHQIRRDLKSRESTSEERSGPSHKKPSDIEICSLPSGYVQPGYIFQTLEEIFVSADLQNCFIDRVACDNVAHWELGCPFVREDQAFGDTLVDLMRRYHRTSLFICKDFSEEPRSVLQRSIIDNADCVIKLARLEVGDIPQVEIRVLKTRDMTHEKGPFELDFDGAHFRIRKQNAVDELS